MDIYNKNLFNITEVQTACVYMLHFGDAFYIGITKKKISRRIQAHKSCINSILKGNNPLIEPSYTNIIEYIKKHNINKLSFSIYAYCDNIHIAAQIECLLLKKNKANKLCLNKYKH